MLLISACLTPAAQAATALADAAKEQDWDAIADLLQEGNADINAAHADGSTALAWAVYWDKTETVHSLLQAGADPDIGNEYGVTPLFLAVENGNAALVRALLEAGADPDINLWSGVKPIMMAAKTGNTGVLELLLKHGADVNARDQRRAQTALMWAIYFGHPAAARVLIENGADVNAETTTLAEDFTPMVLEGYIRNVQITTSGGYTPLMFAARVGDQETARLLVERGAELNQVHHEQGTPLIIAATAGHENLALFLLEQGADPNLSGDDGMTALHYAMRDGLKPLHGYGYVSRSATVVGREKDTILPGGNMYALAEALLRRGADPNATVNYAPPRLRVRPARIPLFNIAGTTPFLLAAATQDVKAMKLLLEAEADPSIGTLVDKENFEKETRIHSSENQYIANATPLMVAVGMGRRTDQDFTAEQEADALEAARLLVGMGADVNAASASGWTPLHAAAFIGADKLVAFLVENGAKLNVRNGCGQTPLSLAWRSSTAGLVALELPTDIRESTAKLLESLGADDAAASAPVGDCVLGRAGLEAELELQKKIRGK
jgi:ankyrin repeat protein